MQGTLKVFAAILKSICLWPHVVSAASLILVGDGNPLSSTHSSCHRCLTQTGLQPLPAPGTEEQGCRERGLRPSGLNLGKEFSWEQRFGTLTCRAALSQL